MTNAKPAFLFIHGAGGTSSKWRKQQELLNDVPAIFIDLPGHGNNEEEIKTTIENKADWVASQVQEDVIVVGHSMGGLIGLELAKKYDNVKGLILAGSHFELPVNPAVLEQLAQGKFSDKFFYASYSKQTPEDVIAEEKEELNINPVSVRKTDLEACDQYIIGKETVQNLSKPILAVYGTEDRLIPRNAEEKLKEVNSSIKTVVIPEAGHYVMLEQPESFNQAILEFRNSFS